MEKYRTVGQYTDDSVAHGYFMLVTEVCKCTLRICNNYLFFHGNGSKDMGLEVSVDKTEIRMQDITT